MCAHFVKEMGLGFKFKMDISSHKLVIDSLNKLLESIKRFNDINSNHVSIFRLVFELNYVKSFDGTNNEKSNSQFKSRANFHTDRKFQEYVYLKRKY